MKRIYAFRNVMATVVLAIASTVTVKAEVSPYISKIYDYLPAPGQFVNVLPQASASDTKESMLAKVAEQLCGEQSPGMITLGAYGGYVVFGFDHTIAHVPGSYDFKVYGNAFTNSAEPGIVMVSYDANANGLPDDEWFELAGSEYGKPSTVKNYTVTYHRPAADTSDVGWTDSRDSTGYIYHNSYHNQAYYPAWIADNTSSFTGARLADNASKSSSGIYTLPAYPWGYVDNQPNASDPGLKIDWAVDKDGNAVNLPGVNFVKVYNAMNQYAGWIGETSTEVCGAEDLHPTAGIHAVGAPSSQIWLRGSATADRLSVMCGADMRVVIVNASGVVMSSLHFAAGENAIDVSAYPAGLYIVRAGGTSLKFIKR